MKNLTLITSPSKGKLRYIKSQQTARAVESLVGSELCNRGYRIIFLGTHHPIAEFQVTAPSGREFLVDAKGNFAPNSWAYPDKIETPQLYYILVELWTLPKPSFYILTQDESIRLGRKYQEDHPRNRNVHGGGFGRTYPYPFKDAWDKLPQ
jgi:hypothetical protein